MVFWNQRMNSLTGQGEYIDVLERSLYNGALDGLSLSGDRFFYGNPLASTGKHARKEWFGTACCPSNIARLISSLGNYVYGQLDNRIFVNLFVGSETNFNLKKVVMGIKTQTGYPWTGLISCRISMIRKENAAIAFRIPGWLGSSPSPGGLYSFAERVTRKPELKVNGISYSYTEENGYAVVDREWKDGDEVSYELPMEVRKIHARAELKQNNSRVALQRGPIIYCVEGADNNGKAWNIISSMDAEYKTEDFNVLDENVVSIVANMSVLKIFSN
jgi:DUF1680 family protein